MPTMSAMDVSPRPNTATTDPISMPIPALIFLITYAGIALGRVPRLALDRTGIALLGALAMILAGGLSPADALDAISFPTLLLLYGLMVVSAQLRLGGFYTWLALRVTHWIDVPERFLYVLMATSGILASVLANDIICLAFTPVLCVALRRKGLNPLPFLLGLAMATNLGSAATLIGNPQSMLIAQTYGLSFGRFLLWCAPPSLAALVATALFLRWQFRKHWWLPAGTTSVDSDPAWPELNRWQTAKGLAATALVIVLLLADAPRALSVLSVAGLLLLSRRMHTRPMLALVDWHLITLFCGLFIVVRGFHQSHIPAQVIAWATQQGFDPANPYTLATVSVLLSNLVSNVPATMLLIPGLPSHSETLPYVLSLATTYAGNLFLLGSLANLIVLEQASAYGIRISFRDYARSGIPITLLNLGILFLWLFLQSQ